MKINIRQGCDYEAAGYVGCVPWYADPIWQNSVFEVTTVSKQGGDYYVLTDTDHNKQTLRTYADFLTGRARVRLSANQLTSFCVGFNFADVIGGNNEDFIFLLKGAI